MSGKGTKEDPWILKTPPQTVTYKMYKDGDVIFCEASGGKLQYDAKAVEDLYKMLKAHKDNDGWMELGAADENKPAKEGTVEAWARDSKNPIGGWYGLKKGMKGRFGMYMPPLLEELGMAEVEHNPRGNRMRAI